MFRQILRASCAALLLLSACDPFGTLFEEVERAKNYEAAAYVRPSFSSRLRVMTYNIKFGGARIDFFFDCHGRRVLMTEDEVTHNLAGIADLIRRADPDVVFLQEVDVLSKRSAYVDQMEFLLENTDLNYGVYASQWQSDFVPSDGIGAVDSGNAILSKYRITDAERLALPLIDEQGALTQYFYLRRNLLVATIESVVPVRVVATHTSAYAQDGTKREQIDLFKQEMDRAEGIVIGAGDLNTLPPGARKTHDFPDSVCTDEDFQADDYREETDYLRELYADYQPAIPLDDYLANERAHFTHTVDGRGIWNRKLDYIFTNAEVVSESGITHRDASTLGVETMLLSDHAPITVEIDLR